MRIGVHVRITDDRGESAMRSVQYDHAAAFEVRTYLPGHRLAAITDACREALAAAVKDLQKEVTDD